MCLSKSVQIHEYIRTRICGQVQGYVNDITLILKIDFISVEKKDIFKNLIMTSSTQKLSFCQKYLILLHNFLLVFVISYLYNFKPQQEYG